MSRNKLSLVALALCPYVDPRTVRKYMEMWPNYEAAWERLAEPAASDCPVRAESYRNLQRWRKQFSRNLVPAKLESYGIRAILQDDARYPEVLLELADPPLVLFAKGQTELLQEHAQSIAIVGTRRASGYALEAASWLADVLAKSGCTIVSGMALGIDGRAHRAALDAGGNTMAVLGSGIDICYPPSHSELYHRICQQGLVVSEYPPGMSAAKHRFPERNRLIAALSSKLVVVQAGDRSGALTTADCALTLGRDVFAVPGPITSKHHRGSNRLLQEGAAIVTEPSDLLLGMHTVASPPDSPEPSRFVDIYQVVTSPHDAATIAVTLGQPVAQIYAGLLELELEGFVERLPGGRYQQRRVVHV